MKESRDLTAVLATAKQQLSRVLGPEKAEEIMAKALRISGLTAITSASQLLLFADAMVQDGGFVEVVGRGLKVEALLRGARASAKEALGALEGRR
ncbi:MAG TPA: hypothetical protein VND93_09335 [Myxococcales bacterium]|nr:hypothetical protein [Myxococcales bacterium]